VADSPFSMPDDLKALSAAELVALRAQLEEQGAAVVNKETHNAEDLKALSTLRGHLDAVKAQETQVAADAAEMAAAIDSFRTDHLTPPAEAPPAAAPAAQAPAAPAAPAEPAQVGELVTAGATPRGKTPVEDLLKSPTLNVSLRGAARRAIAPVVSREDEFIITAAANVNTFEHGQRFNDRSQVADAMHEVARNLGVTSGSPTYTPVATIKNQFDTWLSPSSSQDEVERALKKLTDPNQLYVIENGIEVAGGGFCSPSLLRYDFFNMTCEDGGIDLPTFGVERGGTKFPVSPSLASVFTGAFTSGTNPWLWTETDDIATVTGSPNKPCVRVPCPEFTDVRLECYGICLTAGNLTDSAYPEATRNQIRLLMSALYHASNTRYIQQMVSLASAVVTGGSPVGGAGWVAPTLSAIELFAEDYRTRYGMCQAAPLEVILPHWWLGGARADLSRRGGMAEFMGVSDALLADWFDVRHIRVQFVSDWQVRASGLPGFSATSPSLWPTQVDFLLYAAGTVVRGNGMSLNLGVVRDSVLNAENDHTALWTEECHLIAMVGHEIKQGRVFLCADGTTGAQDLTNCL